MVLDPKTLQCRDVADDPESGKLDHLHAGSFLNVGKSLLPREVEEA